MASKPITAMWSGLAGAAGVPDSIKAALARQGEGFWQAQIKTLDAMQVLATGWFDRRREGAEAARVAVEAVCACSDPVEAVRAYQNWATGSMERIAADVLALQSQALALLPTLAGGTASAAWAPAADDKAKPARAREPAAPRSEAA
jgi:hypothetical protein